MREDAGTAQHGCESEAAITDCGARTQIASSFALERRHAVLISHRVALLARSEQAQTAFLLIGALALWVVGFWYAATRVSGSTVPAALSDVVNTPIVAPPPLVLRKVEPRQALELNEGIPVSRAPNPAAEKFRFLGEEPAFHNAVECLASAIYYEANSETLDGQRAVAQVVLNRVRHAAFPPSICDVVYQGSERTSGCQFTFTCDGALARKPHAARWAGARQLAEAALKGEVFPSVGYATHYHANYVVPYWATSLSKNAVVGNHIFYRWPGWWGTAAAFRRNYSGTEADPHTLREAALRAQGYDISAANGALALATDPRVELISVVQMLASRSRPSAAETEYHAAVRQNFSKYSNHLAVQIFRQLPATEHGSALDLYVQMLMEFSPPPDLQPRRELDPQLIKAAGGRVKLFGFLSALRDFAAQTNFEAFYGAQQSYYTKLSKAWAADPVLLDMGRYRGGRIIVAPLLQTSMPMGCTGTGHDGDPSIVMAIAAAPEASRALRRKQLVGWLTCFDRRRVSATHGRFRSGR